MIPGAVWELSSCNTAIFCYSEMHLRTVRVKRHEYSCKCLFSCKGFITPGVLHPALGSPAQEGCGARGGP